MIITAHGGALGTGRNTQAYFDGIDRYMADAIEVDIWKKDDLLYLSHLPALFRAKKKLTLKYAFELVKQKDILINCDLKMKGIVKDVIDLAKQVGVQDKLIFTGSVRLEDDKDIDCGQVWFNSIGIKYTTQNVKAIKDKILSYNNPHFVGINLNYTNMDVEFVEECNRQGLSISVWRIDKDQPLEKFGKLINGNITTNEPVKVRKYLQENKES